MSFFCFLLSREDFLSSFCFAFFQSPINSVLKLRLHNYWFVSADGDILSASCTFPAFPSYRRKCLYPCSSTSRWWCLNQPFLYGLTCFNVLSSLFLYIINKGSWLTLKRFFYLNLEFPPLKIEMGDNSWFLFYL